MGLAWRPKYEGDEIALGVSLAIALHGIPIALIVLKAMYPNVNREEEKPFVPRPVVAATLLKLGKPLDPNKLPDRLVPKARTAPKQDLVASREDPVNKRDAGAPVPNTKDDDIKRLISKSDPFAEDAGKERPEIGDPRGLDSGTEPDPNKVRAGDMYAAQLQEWFRQRWQIPSVISQGEANRLCVTMQINIDRMMRVWHVRESPVHKSANDLFDDSARTMLQKVMDDHAALPTPPPEVAELYRGRTVNLKLGDGCR
jgi:hypothetical protein